jgi:hypothetical protein
MLTLPPPLVHAAGAGGAPGCALATRHISIAFAACMAAADAGCGAHTAAALLRRLYGEYAHATDAVTAALLALPGALYGGATGAPVMGMLLLALCALDGGEGAPRPTALQAELLHDALPHGAGFCLLRTLLRDAAARKETVARVATDHLSHATAEPDAAVLNGWCNITAQRLWDGQGFSCRYNAWDGGETRALGRYAGKQSMRTGGQGWHRMASSFFALVAALEPEPGSPAAAAYHAARRAAADGAVSERATLEARAALLRLPDAVAMQLHLSSVGASPPGCLGFCLLRTRITPAFSS